MALALDSIIVRRDEEFDLKTKNFPKLEIRIALKAAVPG